MSGDLKNTVCAPNVLWAQRRDILYVTIALGDVKDKVLKLTENELAFSGKSGQPEHKYEVTLKFHGSVNTEGSKQHMTDREILMIIKKKEPVFWPRLLAASEGKRHWLKTDFNRWKDEDESEDEDMDGQPNLEQMMSSMGNFNEADMAGAGEEADEEPDSDDEDLPDLETAPVEATS